MGGRFGYRTVELCIYGSSGCFIFSFSLVSFTIMSLALESDMDNNISSLF